MCNTWEAFTQGTDKLTSQCKMVWRHAGESCFKSFRDPECMYTISHSGLSIRDPKNANGLLYLPDCECEFTGALLQRCNNTATMAPSEETTAAF